jgi:hypothetical protein
MEVTVRIREGWELLVSARAIARLSGSKTNVSWLPLNP